MDPLQWHHKEHDGISNHQPCNCLLNCLFRCRSKKISKLCVTGLCVRNSPVTGEFPAQRACNMENVSIWWRHHVVRWYCHLFWNVDFTFHPSSFSRNLIANHETILKTMKAKLNSRFQNFYLGNRSTLTKELFQHFWGKQIPNIKIKWSCDS